MSKLLKDNYNLAFIEQLSVRLESVETNFAQGKFVEAIFIPSWQQMELKMRMDHIAKTLYEFLPKDYSEAIAILKAITPDYSGFEYMFLPRYVELYGLDKYEESISAMAHFTEAASAEFAVRSFILKYPKEMMAQMSKWAESDNHHLRRLASEGCRPRLPWAMALPEFKKNPDPVIAILDKLKRDDSLYVRKSVANNLNDISKDNPDRVIDIAKSWYGKTANTDWLIKHACRTLLKQGNKPVISLFGYEDPEHIRIMHFNVTDAVYMGGNLEFSFLLNSKDKALGKLRIEYAIDFVRLNGRYNQKVFKITEGYCATDSKEVYKKHSFKPISTRKYYEGMHKLSIIVNGITLAKAEFGIKDR